MTVKELRASLANYPEDIEVFLYNEVGECDGRLSKITVDFPIEEWDGNCEPIGFFTPNYCQADSEAESYWSSFGKDTPIVFLHAENICYDYEKEKRKENV